MSTLTGKIVADFRTSLATELAVGGTTATLQSATDDDGVSLPAGNYYFTVDGNNSQKEHFAVTLSGTSLTAIKSVSRQGVQTSGAVRKHRIGASVVITDFAHIQVINDLINGTTDLNASDPLKYDGTATISDDAHLATKKYVDDTAVAGAPDATTGVKGIVEIATGAELAAGTGTGGTGATVVAAGSSFKNTSAGAGDANKVPVLDAAGLLSDTFLPAVISKTADGIQITTDPDSANDAVRKSYLDSVAVKGVFGDGSDGDVTISTPTTLTRDMFYNNLTYSADITTGGFTIYVKDTLTRTGTAKIKNNGGNGGNGSETNAGAVANAGGIGGVAAGSGALPGSGAGVAGGVGSYAGNSGNNNADAAKNGTSGVSSTNSISSASSLSGGAGGTGKSNGGGIFSGGTAGSAGVTTQTVAKVFSYNAATILAFIIGSTWTPYKCSAVGSGGGGGAISNYTSSTGYAGAGGGSGAPGGVVRVIARIIADSGTSTMFEAIGGNGGNGGAGAPTVGASSSGCGGGGGGAGGNGGNVILIYLSKTGTCTVSVAGGTGGTGGTGNTYGALATATDGAAGSNGSVGSEINIVL